MTAISRLVLDTSAYSHFRRGHPDVTAAMSAAKTVILPAVVLGELHAAFAIGTRQAANEQALARLLAEPFVEYAPLTHEAAKTYGRLVAALRRAGTPISANDIWIAAQTLDVRGHLITFDGDFERVDGLPMTLLRG